MKLGITVAHDGHEPLAQQETHLKDVDRIVTITPMTAEDWHYQLKDAIADLHSGDSLHVAALHYLNHSLAELIHLIAQLKGCGIDIIANGENLTTNGTADAALRLLEAEDKGARANVAHLINIAKNRRNATPPKCIFVPADMLEE